MARMNRNMWATHLTKEQSDKTCGPYWYVVRVDHSMPHTAFRKQEHFEKWLYERGLRLESPITNQGESCRIVGEYAEEGHNLENTEFNRLPHVSVSVTLSNGDYVTALISMDPVTGLRTVHTQGPNVKGRSVVEREVGRAMVG